MSMNWLRFLDPTRWFVWLTHPLFARWERRVQAAADALDEAA